MADSPDEDKVVPFGHFFECKHCGHVKGALVFHYAPDENRWACNCGNDLFFVTKEGVFCPNCAAWQEGM